MNKIKKSPALHITMLVIWAVLTAFLWYGYVGGMIKIQNQDVLFDNLVL